jgi:hypothetical protein
MNSHTSACGIGGSEFHAVLTGDLVGSSRPEPSEHTVVLSVLKSSFKIVGDALRDAVCRPFEIYRGDSFQGVLSDPSLGLRAAVLLRAALRCCLGQGERVGPLDARIAVGIGKIDFLPAERGSEGNGEAYRRSGPALDSMKRPRRGVYGLQKEPRLLIRTPWHGVDAELEAECALLDAIAGKWSPEQAEAILGRLQGLTQEDAANNLGISQSAIGQRLRAAGAWAVEEMLARYEHLVSAAMKSKPYNDNS